MNVATVQGQDIGKLKLGKLFKKIGAAFKKGASFLWKGVAKINPVLVPARAAFLSMVRNNTGGVATKMQRKGIDKARKQWENLGGDFAILQKAVKAGTGKKITGIGAIAENVEPELLAMLTEVRRGAGIQGQDEEIGTLAAITAVLEAAKPIVEKILGVLGIKLGEKEPEQPGAPPQPDPAGQELSAALQQLPPSPVTVQIERAVQQPGTPSPGGGGDGENKIPWVPIAIGGAVLLLLVNNRNR